MTTVSSILLITGLSSYLAGMVAALSLRRSERLASCVGFGLAMAGCMSGLLFGLLALATDQVEAVAPITLWLGPVPNARLILQADALSCFFVVVVSLVGLAISLYSIGYASAYYGRKSVRWMTAFFNALLLATTLVFLAGNVWLFLIAWELMALLAYALVTFEHENLETRRAGVLYFIMSHLDAVCILLGFLILFQGAGDFGFAGLRGVGTRLPAGQRDAAFLLFLLGFGIKAGLVPLHVWLPVAHPVAPSNISALMSGVLIKTGIYGLVRVCFEFLGPPPQWWGVLLLAAGTVSAVLGVLYALMEHDLKRLLAYHSIENIGIIVMGIGASLLFAHAGNSLLSGLALAAGLYHTINHGSFKGLLFLGAGAVLHATHTRNMEEMGGLVRRMPHTAFWFLLGAVAISALPPLNGFISEWLTYQALLQGFGVVDSLWRVMFPLGGAMLALTGALASACFVKAFGISFLAQPRSQAAAQAKEVAATMRWGMALLGGACLWLGLFPTVFLRVLDPVTQQLAGERLSARLSLANGWVLSAPGASAGSVSTAAIALLGVSFLLVPLALRVLLGGRSRIHRGPTWDCGLRGLTPRMEYTATGFSKPLRMIFKALFRPHREVQREYEFSPYFAKSLRFESHVEEVFEQRIYRPVRLWILRGSRRVRALQQGSLQLYLLYIFLTLLGLLLWTT
jgi:hydrogenase-4 component B